MSRILTTNNYDLFVLSPFNRSIKKNRWLKESMLKWGWIRSKPLDVKRLPSGKLEIRDGHHRFVIAKELGIDIVYLETNDGATAFELNMSEKNWKIQDYFEGRIGENQNPAYRAVEDYMQKTGITLGKAINLLAGHSAASGGNLSPRFKNGTFALGDTKHADDVGEVVVLCRSLGIPFASNNLFVQALSKVLLVPKVSVRILKDKITTHVELMKKQVSVKDYIDLLEEVYNRMSRRRIPVAFLADEEARKRNVVLGGKKERKLSAVK